MKVFSVYDMKAGNYGPLVAYNSDEEAMRAIRMALRDRDSQLAMFPSDFNLVYFCDWNNVTGQFSSEDNMMSRVVCNLSALVE